MKIFETRDIREIDAYTIKYEPVSSDGLMERAASACVTWICENITLLQDICIFTGPGNNGGDGWAIARLLADKHYDRIQLYHLQISHIISHDSEINRERLTRQSKVPITNIRSESDFPVLSQSTLIIDALFGSGLARSLEGLSASLVKHINASGCKVISIDVPSGLFGEDNSGNPDTAIINASETLTFQFPKRSFFFAENEKHTGKWHILPIGLHSGIIDEKETRYYYTTLKEVSGKLKNRKLFSHKGTYGHAMLIAGSYGMMGAAILAARACMRTGAGLLTSHIPGACYPIMQASVPESIFSIDDHERYFTQCPDLQKYTALGVGPALGTTKMTESALKSLLKLCRKPLILDADAINILSAHPEMLALIPDLTIITPHPGEFDRLAGASVNGYERNQSQIEFSVKHRLIIILKGAYSSITMPDGRCFYNSSGNPGMATAGCGDVLTGMILSLLAQGYSAEEAAILGTFIHGLAGDLAIRKTGQISLIASDVIEYIGNAFKTIHDHEISVTC